MIRGFASRGTHSVLLSVVMVLFMMGPALAHDFGGTTTTGEAEADPASPPPCDSSCGCQGPANGGAGTGGAGSAGPSGRSSSPISYFNGSESITHTDLVVNGVFPIRVTRKYDSQSTYDSALGHGWAFLHDRALYEYPDGSVIVRHGCGTRDRYAFSGGAYASPAGGMLGNLVENPDGTFELRYANGVTDYFDSQGRLTAVRDTTGNRIEYVYDSRGKLPLTGTSNFAVDPDQPMVVASKYRVIRLEERGADGLLTGRFVTFQYDETTGRLTSVTTNDGRTVSYEHDLTAGLTKGNLIEVQGLEGVVTSYQYNDPNDAHNLTSITAAPGRTPVVNTYDDQDRVILQEEETRKIAFDYQIPLTKTVVTQTITDQDGLNPHPVTTTYEFDETGRITRIIDALGHEARYTYNAAKLLEHKEIWQNNGGVLILLQGMDWTYDTAGHRLTESVTLDSGESITRTWTYDHDWIASEQVVSSADPGKVFRTEYTFFHGADGRPINIQEAKRRRDDGTFQTTSYTYDSRHRPLTTTLPDGVKIVNEYTGDYVTKMFFEVGGVEIPQMTRRFDYDAQGNRIKKWDARNNLTEFGYDDRRRLISITNPLGEQTLYTFLEQTLTQIEVGRTVADGEGQVTKLLYDSRDRLTGVQRKDDTGTFIDYLTFELDSLGQRLSVTDAENRTTLMSYDLLGRVASVTDALSNVTEFGYDAAGNRTLVRDALAREVHYEYDDVNRLTTTVQLGVTPNPRTEYAYDAAGNITAVTDPEDHTTVYAYDALSRNTSVTQPLGQVVTYAYDSRNRLDFLVNARGQKIDYAYEAWGPIEEEKQYPTVSAVTPDRTIAYGYDNDGNLTTVTDDGIQTGPIYSITYDALSRPYDETVKYIPGGDRVLQHRYDRYGNRNELALLDGTSVARTHSYNKLNQLASASLAGDAISLSYYANDDLQTVTLPGGVSRSYTYRPNGPVEAITVDGPSGQIAQFSYTYDPVLNVDSMSDADGLHDYGYDGLDRLTQATRPAGIGLPDESYIYDGVGHRKDTANPSQWQYDDNNRIVQGGALTYTFDADGNLATRSDGATFTHDARNRLVAYSHGATTAVYRQDPMGRRISKAVDGTTTWFLWDGMQLLAEYDASGTREQRYGYLAGQYAPAQIEDANGIYYTHADRLATPRLLTGATAQPVWSARFEAYGKTVVDDDPDANSEVIELNLRFPGQYFDAESGFHYNYYRVYDPTLGRYIEADPIGLRGGINAYAYVGNAPANFVDPMGLFLTSVDAACMRSPQLCAELTGQIIENAAAQSRDPCVRDELGEVADTLRELATVADVANVGKTVVASAIKAVAAKGAKKAATAAAQSGAARAIDPNKLHHIFGKAGHNLDDVVEAVGSREAAFEAMEKGAQSALNAGRLATDSRGVFEMVVNIGGADVTVAGRVVDGVARIGSAWK